MSSLRMWPSKFCRNSNLSAYLSIYSRIIIRFINRDKLTGLPTNVLKQYHWRHFSKSINTGINIILHLVLITYGDGTSHHYHPFHNNTVSHVTSLACKKAFKQLVSAIAMWASFKLLVLLTHKTDVFLIQCYGQKLYMYFFTGDQINNNVTNP